MAHFLDIGNVPDLAHEALELAGYMGRPCCEPTLADQILAMRAAQVILVGPTNAYGECLAAAAYATGVPVVVTTEAPWKPMIVTASSLVVRDIHSAIAEALGYLEAHDLQWDARRSAYDCPTCKAPAGQRCWDTADAELAPRLRREKVHPHRERPYDRKPRGRKPRKP